jgi:hypothetical protein
MALAGWVPRIRRPGGTGRAGLGLLPQLQVLPHFDAYFGRVPDLATRALVRAPDGVTTVGIDENTALVGGPEEFRVEGRRSAWVLGQGRRREVPPGAEVRFPLPS